MPKAKRDDPPQAALLRDEVLGRLRPLPVSARSMFGGHGLYLEGRFFGIVIDEAVYFRTDETSRAEYVARGSVPLQPKFRPRGPKTVDRNFTVPAEVLNDGQTLRAWALRAAAADRE